MLRVHDLTVCLQPPSCNGCRGEAGGVVTFIFLQKLAQIISAKNKWSSSNLPMLTDQSSGSTTSNSYYGGGTSDRLASIQGPLLELRSRRAS